jgi:hypothetical protein
MAVLSAAARPGHPFWHFLVLVSAAVAVFVWIKIAEWTRRSTPEGRPPRPQRRAWTAIDQHTAWTLAALSATAAAVHAQVGPEHFWESAAFGVFFLGAAAAQAAWAVAVCRRPGRTVLLAGAAANAAFAALWAVSRTIGVPFGPQAWRPEAVSQPDVVATLLELSIVAAVARIAWANRGRHVRHSRTVALGRSDVDVAVGRPK